MIECLDDGGLCQVVIDMAKLVFDSFVFVVGERDGEGNRYFF